MEIHRDRPSHRLEPHVGATQVFSSIEIRMRGLVVRRYVEGRHPQLLNVIFY